MTAQRLALPLIALFWTGGFAPSGQDCALSLSGDRLPRNVGNSDDEPGRGDGDGQNLRSER
jgi:hypothetical protein